MKKIAIITARSGSKGLPNKNILMLLNKPLMAYTIEAAIKSKCFEKVILTTDSLEYKEIGERYGAKVLMRGKELSGDNATSYDVIEDVLKRTVEIDYEYFVLLQPTSPFRNENHIKEAIEKFEKNRESYDFLVSVAESQKSAKLIQVIDEDKSLKNFEIDFSNYRRQDYKEYYPNGAIFIGKKQTYLTQKHFFGKKSLGYFMDKESSVDIDDIIDFELAITLMQRKEKKKLLKENILKRIESKKESFLTYKEVTLIGHSLFDNWNIEKIGGLPVNNFGIAGINTDEYNKYVFDKNLISKIGNKVFIFAGTNDIVLENWKKESSLQWIEKCLENIKKINTETEIFFLEIPRVVSRMDRNNKIIEELNIYLRKKLPKDIKFVELGENFKDKYGNLKLDYTYDGLHFNDNGYEQLKNILEKELENEKNTLCNRV